MVASRYRWPHLFIYGAASYRWTGTDLEMDLHIFISNMCIILVVSGACVRACTSVSTPGACMPIGDFCIFMFKTTCTIHCQASFICIKSKRYVCQLMCTMCMWDVNLCFDMFANRMLPLLTSIQIRGAVAEYSDVGSCLCLFFGSRK